MDSVTVPPEDIEEGKREFKEEYYNSFTIESLKEAGAEIEEVKEKEKNRDGAKNRESPKQGIRRRIQHNRQRSQHRH